MANITFTFTPNWDPASETVYATAPKAKPKYKPAAPAVTEEPYSAKDYPDSMAKPNCMFMCPTCGRVSRDTFGYSAKNGWKSCCKRLSVLVAESSLIMEDGRATYARAVKQ